MRDYCAERRITFDIEMIAIDPIGRAYDCGFKRDVKYRFVINLGTLK